MNPWGITYGQRAAAGGTPFHCYAEEGESVFVEAAALEEVAGEEDEEEGSGAHR